MRLNLNPGAETYVLVAPNPDIEGDEGIFIVATPALSTVMEETKGDPALLEFGKEINEILKAQELDDETEETSLENSFNPEIIRARGKAGVIFAKVVAGMTIESWGGFTDEEDNPVEPSPEYINAMMEVPALYERYTEVYLARWLTVQQEKNGSAPSLNGTSAEAQITAGDATASAQNARAGKTSPKA